MMNRRRFLAISAIAAGVGLVRLARREVHWHGLAMGADVSITLYGASESDATDALQAARSTITKMERLFSLYDPESEICRLNRDQWCQVSADFSDLIEIADHAHGVSDGLFDPTVQAVFAAKLKGAKIGATPVGWKHVSIDTDRISFQRDGMAITLNGIAQGFATDRVRDVLVAHGFDRTLVNIGEFRAGAQRALIGVGGVNGDIIATEDIADAAIATSSISGFRFSDGSSHIFNPFSLDQPHWASASVIASDAAMADALSTSVLLAKGDQLARRLVHRGEAQVIILEDFAGRVVRL
jgi:FAD:protein FMN transferase